ncbi:uncharacterized protein LOC143021496 [Oratosquilla oratoria]|uniref:uncharacterized protein LOC143021496 n=1 Tax=Oratosquilla oratoria TaxID=337810 RepID=UPI003F75E27E
MNRELVLVLGIYEGRGWCPETNHTAVVEAKLDGHTLATDPIPLVTQPKFFTEITWQADRNTIRKYKLSRVPIHIECFSIHVNGKKKFLGYIILPLASAVEGVTSDPKWHAILGSSLCSYKETPSLLITLNLEAKSERIMDEISPSSPVESEDKPKKYTKDGPKDKKEVREEPEDEPNVDERNYSPPVEEINLISPIKRKTRNSMDDNSVVEIEPHQEREPQQPKRKDCEEERKINQSETTIDIRSPVNVDRIDRSSRTPSDVVSTEFDQHFKICSPQQQTDRSRSGSEQLSSPAAVIAHSPSLMHLTPRLHPDGGFFQLGRPGEDIEMHFEFSVTVYFVKDLHGVIPSNLSMAFSNKFYFRYSLLGVTIVTDAFTSLDEPNFVPQRASARLHASQQNLLSYLDKNHLLPIHLCAGDVCLATAVVNLKSLTTTNFEEGPRAIEGGFELQSSLPSSAEGEGSVNQMVHNVVPVVGLCIELAFQEQNSPSFRGDRAKGSRINEKHSMSPISVYSTDGSTSCTQMNLSEDACSDSVSSIPSREFQLKRNKESSRYNKTLVKKKEKQRANRKSCRYCTEGSGGSGKEDNFLSEEVEKLRKKLFQDAALEVEEWKEQQEKIFLQQWSTKEEELQKILSEEWKERVFAVEEHLQSRLADCDRLQAQLTATLQELTLREDKVKAREAKVNAQAREVRQLEGKSREEEEKGREAFRRNTLAEERQKRLQMEKKLHVHQERIKELENIIKDKDREISSLYEQLSSSSEIDNLKRDKKILEDQNAKCKNEKQYYKTQWIKALTKLQSIQTVSRDIGLNRKYIIGRPRRNSGVIQQEPQSSSASESPMNGHSGLEALIDERNTLLESGLYTFDHVIIKDLDRKIRTLSGD